MPGYQVSTTDHDVGVHHVRVRGLLDRQQFSDEDGAAEALGISSAQWSLFGVVWPSALALAVEMTTFPVDGLRILEVGCGLGLASLVLQQRGADVTASDHHPLAAEFLAFNTHLNGLPPIPFRRAPWEGPNPDLGRFDLVIGSDVLYERGHPSLLAAFVAAHSNSASGVVLTDPGRAHRGRFVSALLALGFAATARRVAFERQTKLGHVLGFRRSAATPDDALAPDQNRSPNALSGARW